MEEQSKATSASRETSTTDAHLDNRSNGLNEDGYARDVDGELESDLDTDDKGVLDEKSTGLIVIIMLALSVSSLLSTSLFQAQVHADRQYIITACSLFVGSRRNNHHNCSPSHC